MYHLYSVELLFESIAKPKPTPEKIFEERIVLIRTKKKENIHDLIYAYFPPDTYANAEGGITTNKLAKILDVFELVDDILDPLLETEYKEVYSRYIIAPEDITAENVLKYIHWINNLSRKKRMGHDKATRKLKNNSNTTICNC